MPGSLSTAQHCGMERAGFVEESVEAEVTECVSKK